jgi:DNA-binding GntR family transcriptional regulator
MDPKGKGMVVNDKEKGSFVNDPKDDKPTDSGSSHKRKDGRKKKTRRIKEIVYYDSDESSSSQKDDDNVYEKKKTVNSNFSFDYSRIPQSSNAHLLSIPLGKPLTLMERTTDFGVTKCVATCSLSIQVYGK